MGRPDSAAPITQQPLPQDSLVAGSHHDTYRTQLDSYRNQQDSYSTLSHHGERPSTPTQPEQVFANISYFLTASPTRPPLKYKTKGKDAAALAAIVEASIKGPFDDAAAIAAIVEAARRGSFDAWAAHVAERMESRVAPDAYAKCRQERYSLHRDADSIFDPPSFSLLRKVAQWIVSSEWM